ncbi:hydroxymethylbilane synthase [Parasphingorhabdus sp. JC815]|uniref:hydroxymethylbilane synthase n=1 Tax=Parasphingorhabdus sp. JC815 TaxID=3232140 RepID=UPI00345A1159
MTKNNKPDILPGIDRPLRIGTRESPLAMAQAKMVATKLLSIHGWRPDMVELVPIVATGDRIQDRALADIGGKALWTKELDWALHEGEIDCAVHSMKDVETLRPDTLIIAAMLERADTHDRLIGAGSIDDLPQGAIVGTASPRRRAQLLLRRGDLDIRLIRGNVHTRLAKIKNGEFSATLLAAAGLLRLGMDDIGTDLPDDIMMPAPAQGAIGIETLSRSSHLRGVLKEISHHATFRAIMAERAFLKELTADCHSPVGALATVDGMRIKLRAKILMPDGSENISKTSEFDVGDVEAPALLARKLLGEASEELKAIFS